MKLVEGFAMGVGIALGIGFACAVGVTVDVVGSWWLDRSRRKR